MPQSPPMRKTNLKRKKKKSPTVTIFKCLKNVVWCHDSKARRPSSVISSFWLRSSATSHTGRNLSWAAERGGGGKGESEKWKSSGLIHCVPSAMHATVPRLMAGRGVRAQANISHCKASFARAFFHWEAGYRSSLRRRLIFTAWSHVMPNSSISFFIYDSVHAQFWEETVHDKHILKTYVSLRWSAPNLKFGIDWMPGLTLPPTPVAAAPWQPLTSPNPSYNFTPQITALSLRHPVDTSFRRQLRRAGISP